MVFQPGQSGNPGGQRGRKPLIDAMNTILTMGWEEGGIPDLPTDGSFTVAHAMAHNLVKGSMRSDWKPGETLEYFREVCDRTMGKPKETVEQTTVSAVAVIVGSAVDELPENARERLRHVLAKTAPMIENGAE